MHKDFDGWNQYQKYLESKQSPLFDFKSKRYRFKAGEIWFCSVGVNIASEICGKNNDFERPVIILKKSGRHFICLPLTSKKPKNKLLYFDLTYNKPGGELIESYALVSNPKSYDVNRLIRKIKRINDSDFKGLIKKTKTFI